MWPGYYGQSFGESPTGDPRTQKDVNPIPNRMPLKSRF